ncbi:uncharacterized protein LOC122854094 [Aphidius gifuensis]|uniref:uncharacterized protein LOC122854094 n=1 Tax=Aphidius gifuensis TaxID=684658 RepID=UPI001CDCFA7C|nr:uncharacterized protein LOC122854094 [Aphidius gifuensis]
MGRLRSVIAQGSTPEPAPIRRSLRLSSKTRRDGIAKCMKLNTQNKKNIKNAILLESSPLRPRSVIAQSSTPAPIDHVVNDDKTECSKSRGKIKILRWKRMSMRQINKDLAEGIKLLNKQIKQNKKNIKIAAQIIMKRVNDDCLAEIFMYVPACERPKIAMVCKKWKRALDYSWFNVKKLELTYWRYHELPCCLKKYQTVDGKLNFLKSLLDKCGRYLKTLDLTAYDRCNIVPIINDYCPNLEKLRVRFIDIDDTMLSNTFTRLSKLKSLTIIFENMKGKSIPVTLINSLKNVAGTLTELNLLNFVNHLDESCDYPKEFDCVIRELKVMKKFEVAGVRDSKNSFKLTNANIKKIEK